MSGKMFKVTDTTVKDCSYTRQVGDDSVFDQAIAVLLSVSPKVQVGDRSYTLAEPTPDEFKPGDAVWVRTTVREVLRGGPVFTDVGSFKPGELRKDSPQ